MLHLRDRGTLPACRVPVQFCVKRRLTASTVCSLLFDADIGSLFIRFSVLICDTLQMERSCDWYLGQWSAREGIWEQQGRQQQGKGKVGMVLWLHIRDLVSTSGTGSWSCEPAAPSMGLTALFCVASCGLLNKNNICQILAIYGGASF